MGVAAARVNSSWVTDTLEHGLRTTCRDRPLKEARKIVLPDKMDRGSDIHRQTYRLTNYKLLELFMEPKNEMSSSLIEIIQIQTCTLSIYIR